MKNKIFNFKQKEDVVIETNNVSLKITKIDDAYKIQLKCPKTLERSGRVAYYSFREGVFFESLKEEIPQLEGFLTVRNETDVALEICTLYENVLNVYFYLKDYKYDWTSKYSFTGKQDMYIYPGSENYDIFVQIYNEIKKDILEKEVALKNEHKSNRIKH